MSWESNLQRETCNLDGFSYLLFYSFMFCPVNVEIDISIFLKRKNIYKMFFSIQWPLLLPYVSGGWV